MHWGEAMAKTAERDGGRGGVPWRLIGWGGAGLLLLTPLVAMQFTDEVAWTGFDFAFMGGLFAIVGLGLELAVRKRRDAAYRIAVGLALAAAFFLIWLNGAVGIIGSENEDANLLFLGVIAVAFIGAIAARFRPAGMVWAMRAAALAQVAVPFVAATFGPAVRVLLLRQEVTVLTLVFTAMWLTSAELFRRAAQRRDAQA